MAELLLQYEGVREIRLDVGACECLAARCTDVRQAIGRPLLAYRWWSVGYAFGYYILAAKALLSAHLGSNAGLLPPSMLPALNVDITQGY